MFHLNFEQKKDFFRIYLALSKYKVGWRTHDKSPIPPPLIKLWLKSLGNKIF